MSSWSNRDKAVVWHPFTQMKNAPDPIAIVRGKGALLFDEHGRDYIDAVASWWVNAHGHAHPYIQQKVSEQLGTLEHVIFAGFTHPWAIELSERLVGILPGGQQRVFFSDNGSSAVEVALKMALQYWYNQGSARNRIVAFENAYHGDTVGAMSAGGRGSFSTPFESILFDVEHMPVPTRGSRDQSLKIFRGLLEKGDVAAFIYEPVVQGAGGMVMYDLEIMDEMLQMARDTGVLLIADEVMTGFGRTATFFASEQFSIEPDIMALSKALTGGTMALSVTTCTQEVYDAFLSDDHSKTFFHGHSYTANPTACAASLASLDLYEKPEFARQKASIIEQHELFIKRLQQQSNVKNIRMNGTILAFDVATDGEDSYFNNIRDVLYNGFLERRVILRPLGNTVYILPPFCINEEQLERVYSAIMDVLHSL